MEKDPVIETELFSDTSLGDESSEEDDAESNKSLGGVEQSLEVVMESKKTSVLSVADMKEKEPPAAPEKDPPGDDKKEPTLVQLTPTVAKAQNAARKFFDSLFCYRSITNNWSKVKKCYDKWKAHATIRNFNECQYNTRHTFLQFSHYGKSVSFVRRKLFLATKMI